VSVRAAALETLAVHWGAPVTVRELFVEHKDRAVMRCVDPAGRSVVIKADRDPERLRREATALAAATAAEVPVPAVYEWVDGPPALLVLAYVDGRPLGSASPDEHWRAVGRELRRLHDHARWDAMAGSPARRQTRRASRGAGVPLFGGGDTWWGQLRSLADWANRWCDERNLLAPAVLDRLRDCMDAGFGRNDEPECRLLHGDCGPDHWLLGGDTVAAVLDFGDTGRGDPAWDLAVLTLWDRRRLPSVLDAYGVDEAMRGHLEAVLMPYTVVRHLLAISWLVEHDFDPTPTVTELHRLASLIAP
jgi:Ser/Thr protein kinase RdoA (MazF antagonist)